MIHATRSVQQQFNLTRLDKLSVTVLIYSWTLYKQKYRLVENAAIFLTRGGPQNGRLGNILRKQYLGLWLKLINDTYTCSKALPDVSRKAKRNFEKMF